MKAKELRIGNLVYLNSELYEVESGSFSEDNIADVSVLEFVEPIPLTEEWLLRFGFKQDIERWFDLGNIGVNFELKRIVYTTHDTEGNEVYNDIPFKEYVHGFQNLFFALTGKELECQTT